MANQNGATTASNVSNSIGVVQTGVAAAGGVVDAISGAINAASTAIGNVFSSIGRGITPLGIRIPLNNPLHDYASYSYVISLYCLSTKDHNYPDSSYIAGILPPAIFRTSSVDPNNRVRTEAGKYDFYVDNLMLNGYFGFEKGTGLTNTMNFEMTVIEPYSMGQFMVAVQQAAAQVGHKNFNAAPYLLTIEFFGMDQLGVPKKVPKTTKYIPFNFNQMNMKVNGAGSIYTVVGIPTNATALNDSVKTTKTEVTIKGKTVQEMLQTGPHSLQAALNKYQADLKKNNKVAVPDEYVITFPTSISSAGNRGLDDQPGASLVAPEKVVGATKDVVNSFSDQAILSRLGLSRSDTNKTLVQSEGACNAIGKSPMRPDPALIGKPETAPDSKTFSDNGTPDKSQVKGNPEVVPHTYKAGSDILKIINEVIAKSMYSETALKADQIDTNGMRPMWRVDTQVFVIDTDANMSTTGTKPALYVYRVVPYQMHASKVIPPGAGVPNTENLKNQAVKVYNYIYTGNNRDILKFEFEIANAFYALFGSVDEREGDEKDRENRAGVSPGETEQAGKDPKGGENPGIGFLPRMAKFITTITDLDNQGGAPGERIATRVMKRFIQALKADTDMLNITMDIVGDPYYIANSGLGNYSATPTDKINIHEDGSISYQNGEVDIVIYFRSPVDINQTTGLYDFSKNTKLATMFSGLYKLTNITSSFKGGKFTQTLQGYRRPGQEVTDSTNPSENLPTSETVQKNSGTAA